MSAEAGEQRWPFRIPVQMYLAIATLAIAPHWSVLGLPSSTLQQKSYVELSAIQYEAAFEAIVARARPQSLPAERAPGGTATGTEVRARRPS